MNKLVTSIVSLLAVVAIVISAVAVNKVPSEGPQGQMGPQGPRGERGTQGPIGLNGQNGKEGSGIVGSVTGPDTFFDYYNNNNVYTYYVGKNFNLQAGLTGSTTPCSIRSPLNATTTLVRTTFQITTSTSTVSTLTVATSTNAFATTTPLITPFSVPGSQYSFVYTGTTTTGTNGGTVGNMGGLYAPGIWIVYSLQGEPTGSVIPKGGFVVGGKCTAVFQGL